MCIRDRGTVLGGGRYDGLIEALGGPPTAAVGWAAGIERLAMLIAEPSAPDRAEAIIVVESDGLEMVGLAASTVLRRANVKTDLIASGSIKKRFDRAVKRDPDSIVSLGLDAEGGVSVRVRSAAHSREIEQILEPIDWKAWDRS